MQPFFRAQLRSLPETVRDLSVVRVGDGVELRFTVPQKSTDGLLLRGTMALGSVCRAEGAGPCLPFPGAPGFRSLPTHDAAGNANIFTMHDDLGPALCSGPPRLLAYRVEFFNAGRRSAGPSDPALAAAGEGLPIVANLEAEGSRRGVLLQWQTAHLATRADVWLRREPIATPPAAAAMSAAKEEAVWLQANAASSPPGDHTLDDSAQPGGTYRYTAQRRRRVSLAGHDVEVRSELSAPLAFTFADTFPPPAPTDITAAGFGARDQYAVDLIWDPVNDRTVVGYLLTRVALDREGTPKGAPQALNTTPLATPSFHDTSADPAARYRYSVVSADAKGLRSAAATVMVDAATAP